MRVFTGDHTGLVKSVKLDENKILSKAGWQQKENQVIGIHSVDVNDILSANQSNIVSIYQTNGEGIFNQESRQIQQKIDVLGKSVSLNYESVLQNIILTSTEGSIVKTKYNELKQSFSNQQKVIQLNYKGIVQSKLNPTKPEQLLVLAKNTNPKLINIEKQAIQWEARNVQNDWLDLEVPIYDMDCAFFNSGKQVYVTTAFNKIRIYDIQSQKNKKPVLDIEQKYEISPYNKVILSHCENYLYVSNHLGSIFILDKRKNLDQVGKLKGASATISHMALHPTENYLATTCLDRFLRIYDLDTKNMQNRIFMKQQLTHCHFSRQITSTQVEKDENLEIALNYQHPQIKIPIQQEIKEAYNQQYKKKDNKKAKSLQIYEKPHKEVYDKLEEKQQNKKNKQKLQINKNESDAGSENIEDMLYDEEQIDNDEEGNNDFAEDEGNDMDLELDDEDQNQDFGDDDEGENDWGDNDDDEIIDDDDDDDDDNDSKNKNKFNKKQKSTNKVFNKKKKKVANNQILNKKIQKKPNKSKGGDQKKSGKDKFQKQKKNNKNKQSGKQKNKK